VKIKSIPLDCGCTWITLEKKIELDKVMHKECNKSLTRIDVGLINDFISFKYTALMVSDRSGTKKDSIFIDLLNKAIGKEPVKDIVWILKDIKAVIQLYLYYNKISNADTKLLCEEVKTNKILVSIDLSSNDVGVEALKQLVKYLELMELLNN
jgi:hypothetical protein